MISEERNCGNCVHTDCIDYSGEKLEPCSAYKKAYFNTTKVTVREIASQIVDQDTVKSLLKRHMALDCDTNSEDTHLNLQSIKKKEGNVISVYKIYNFIGECWANIWVHTVFKAGKEAETFIYTAEER